MEAFHRGDTLLICSAQCAELCVALKWLVEG
jgi:hypothetical protein